MPNVGINELFRFRTERLILHKGKSGTADIIPGVSLLIPALV
jgi:hypothetical protein